MRILGSLGGNEYILHVRGLYIGEAAFKMVPSDLCLLLLLLLYNLLITNVG